MSLPNEILPVGLLSRGVGYQIPRSLRFNSSDSAYLSRTPASAGNRRKWTWSGWVKSSVTSRFGLFGTDAASNTDGALLQIDSSYKLTFSVGYTIAYGITSTAIFRDPSAWQHVIAVFDCANATAAHRMRLYVNGVELTDFDSDSRSSLPNQDWGVNSTISHSIGRNGTAGGVQYFNGYLADIHFIDGQALTPSDFAETDATTGQWVPKEYTGSYGTNGFHLPFSDNSTAAALGTDTSGNGNNWTPNNFSVAAGSGNDSLVDTPTSYGVDAGNGGEVRGNYATLNPLYGGPIPTNGNLDVSLSIQTSYATISFTTSKWYWELTATAAITSGYVGVMDSTYLKTDNNWGSQARSYQSNGNKYDGSSSAYGASWANGDVIGVAVDMDAGTIVFYKNGASQGTAFSDLSGKEWRPFIYASAGSYTMNFGQRPFAYTAPSGFKALCDTNLPAPVVAQPSTVMDVKLYTGNGSTQTISGLGFSPDLVWLKSRSSGGYAHRLNDTVRGATKELYSNLTSAEFTDASGLTAFNSDGFSIGSTPGYNENTGSYVAWCFDAGSNTVSNTQGSITSTVRANPSAGFSIVTWTGTGSNGATVGHGLGVAPSFVIIKQRIAGPGTDLYNWNSYHSSLGATKYIALNKTDAATTAPLFNDTAPTSTVFSLGSSTGSWNNVNDASGVTYVAYCFAPVPGYSSFGSYTGNGSTDGPFVYTGHRSRFILLKRTDTTSDWYIFDTSRNTYNALTSGLFPNASDAEATNSLYAQDVVANGWKIRSSQTQFNASGGTYVYASFAESPFKTSRAR